MIDASTIDSELISRPRPGSGFDPGGKARIRPSPPLAAKSLSFCVLCVVISQIKRRVQKLDLCRVRAIVELILELISLFGSAAGLT
jgi:hypothetical protein